jgi:hypothetical protein
VCQVFNAKTKKWSKVAAMNCKRSAVGAVALGDHLYVCGGFDGISRFEPPLLKKRPESEAQNAAFFDEK